jgi:hypothetical protein
MADEVRKHRQETIEKIVKAAELYRRGKSLEEVGRLMQCTKESARQWLNHAVRRDIMSAQEYSDLKNYGSVKKRRAYFSDLLENIDHIDNNSWMALCRVYDIGVSRAGYAERMGLEELSAGENPIVQRTLDVFGMHGVILSRLEELAGECERLTPEVNMIRYVLHSFKQHKMSLARLSLMAREYVVTNSTLGETAAKYLAVNHCNPASDARQQLSYAVRLGIISQESLDLKGLASQKAAWIENGKRRRNFSNAQ